MKAVFTPKQRAFAAADLLALLGGLTMIAAVGVPTIGKARLRDQQAVCASHLKALGRAATSHAFANNDQFPRLSGAYWPWDLPAAAANRLVENGARRQDFYCPSVTQPDTSPLWGFTSGSTNDIAKPETGFRVAGYQFAFADAGRVARTNITESLRPEPWTVNGTKVNPPLSQRVIAADAILSVGANEEVRESNRFSKIDGGWAGHQSAHMTGTLPAGGNLLFADGHVNWQRFPKMHVRTVGDPSFWW